MNTDYRLVNGSEWSDGYETGEGLGYKDAPEAAIEDATVGKSESWVLGFNEGYQYGLQLHSEREEI